MALSREAGPNRGPAQRPGEGEKKLSDTPSRTDQARSERSAAHAATGGTGRGRKRRGLRIALVSLASVFALTAAVAVGGVLVLNHLASNIRRVPVTFAKLAAADRAAGNSSQAMSVLMTGTGVTPSGSASPFAGATGLVMVLHINANQQAGGVVSIPPQVVVPVPGHGQMKIANVLGVGGPSLLARTVEGLTGVQLEHYASINFGDVANVVNAVGGVTVDLPAAATSSPYTFHAGTNHLNGAMALAYVRQRSLSEDGRVLRQQSLIRAVLTKIADDHLLSNPVTTYQVLSALTAMLTVDSNFTNSELASLAGELKGLGSGAGTYVTAPASGTALQQPVSDQLWRAIQQDSIAAFAKRHPGTVTPAAVP
jgi:LCP family protein required for cell wall assembly